MPETALQEPACAAFLVSHNVIQPVKAGDLYIIPYESDGDAIRSRHNDGIVFLIKANGRDRRACHVARWCRRGGRRSSRRACFGLWRRGCSRNRGATRMAASDESLIVVERLHQLVR